MRLAQPGARSWEATGKFGVLVTGTMSTADIRHSGNHPGDTPNRQRFRRLAPSTRFQWDLLESVRSPPTQGCKRTAGFVKRSAGRDLRGLAGDRWTEMSPL